MHNSATDLHGSNTDHTREDGVTRPFTGPLSEITSEVIGAAFAVFNELGYGFLEKVYQRALQVELLRRKISADLEAPIPVRYRGVTVGEYYADVLAGGEVLVELKVALAYQKPDEAQLLNALKASGKAVGLLINFGRHKVEFRRFLM